MATLATKTIQQIVEDYAAAAQATCAQILDFTLGSINLAYGEAIADVATWLQALIAYVMTLRWASTSFGIDLDSWMADWNFFRLPAAFATGVVTFSRYTPTLSAVVPIGTTVASTDGTLLFTVYADTTNILYSADAGGYVVPAGVPSGLVPVQAALAGKAYNVLAGTITQLRSTISFDTVTNTVGFINGIDAESDKAFRARFILYIASLSKGTVPAIEFAVASVAQNLQCNVNENVDYNGNPDSGFVTVVVDDGSGNMPLSTLILCQTQINIYRAASIRVGVFAAVALYVNVSLSFTVADGYTIALVEGAVSAAIANYINGLGLNNPLLPYTMIEHLAYGVPGVTNVTNVSLNGGTSDIVAAFTQTLKCRNVAASGST